jgi:hypothetical protein
MVEVLVIFGFLSWLFLAFLQWLSTLPAFPAMLAGAILCPLLSMRDYGYLIRAWRLQGVVSKRDPIPPERFYWIPQKRRLRRMTLVCTVLSLFAWSNALILPASSEISLASVFGWANAVLGIVTLTRTISTATLYYSASQWFDAQSPGFVRLLRQAMYKLSDNYEYLHPTKRDHEKEEVY